TERNAQRRSAPTESPRPSSAPRAPSHPPTPYASAAEEQAEHQHGQHDQRDQRVPPVSRSEKRGDRYRDADHRRDQQGDESETDDRQWIASPQRSEEGSQRHEHA